MKAASNAASAALLLSLSGIRDAKRPSLSRKKSSNTPRPDYIVGKTKFKSRLTGWILRKDHKP